MNKYLMPPVTHSVRRNQVVLQYGVGAMIDFPSQVLMTAMPEMWGKPKIIHDERLEKMLGVDHFISPSDDGVSFVRFPRWYFCPKCRSFKPIEEWQKEYAEKFRRNGRTNNDPYMLNKVQCVQCKAELVPARIVSVCEHGHIDDFPWVNWVHRNNHRYGGEKPICSNPKLKLKTGASASSGLEGVEIECVSCGAKATLAGIFDTNGDKSFVHLENTSKYGIKFTCTGHHPWKRKVESCGAYPVAKQRGASAVYFPRSISSLVIPPYSSRLTSKIEKSIAFNNLLVVIQEMTEDMDSPEQKIDFINKQIEKKLPIIAAEIQDSQDAIKSILQRKFYPSNNLLADDAELLYKAEEYKALTGKIKSDSFALDEFVREKMDTTLYNIKGVKSIALIHKVKEVTALIGFSRIQPTNAMDETDDRFVSIKEEKTRFYPATSSKGEGIFIEFDKSKLTECFSTDEFIERAKELQEKYNNSLYGRSRARQVESEFVFLHTFAHLLIKELSYNCGYPIASIRERLYYGNVDGEDMCGMFIYTTGGDSEGTLGGLVRQGYSDCLPGVVGRALEQAKFCANDPVCSFSDGQGIEALNYAACHSCVLLPETSCENMNILLDRTLVVGNMDNSIKGFFN